ncbi:MULTISPECIES: HNH endonuclease [Flavobacterium]|uniref:HNH endonuclease n=1 Tax=Flavobacterium TaxID=237 RepID=UPI00248018AB|nr:hypothetical protein [Flavobacterium gelatinilyticum]
MKNFREFDGDSKEVYRNAVERKEDALLRARLTGIAATLGGQYDVYDYNFNRGSLSMLHGNPLFVHHGPDIRSLYGYDTLVLRELRNRIQRNIPASVRYTCQYCTVTPVESFDHYLPKEEFPEYSVHTNNLVPCCKTCNGYKSYVWRNNAGERLFLNFYRDILPAERFLFADVIDDGQGDIDFRYYLANPSGIPLSTFNLIQSHFTRLRLEERMRMKAVGIISELENSLLVSTLSTAESTAEVLASAQRNFASYGTNYWRSIAEIALVQSPLFLERLEV